MARPSRGGSSDQRRAARSLPSGDARKFNYELHAICEDFRLKQLSSPRKVVTRKRRRPVAYVLTEVRPEGG